MSQHMLESTDWHDHASVDAEAGESRVDLLGMLMRQKWIIAFGIALGVALGYLVYVQSPVVYASRSKVQITRKNPTAIQIGGESIVTDHSNHQSHDKVVDSTHVIQQAVRDCKLNELESFAGKSIEDVVADVADGLEVLPDKDDSTIYYLTFRGPHRQDCRSVLWAVVKTYDAYLNDQYRGEARAAIENIERARDFLKNEFTAADQAVEDFLTQEPLLVDNEDVVFNVHRQRMVDVESKRHELDLERTELKYELEWLNEALTSGQRRDAVLFVLEKIEKQDLTSDEDIAENATKWSAENSGVMELRVELEDLLIRFGEDHPQVRSVRRRIAAWEKLRNMQLALASGREPEDEPVDTLSLYATSLQDRINNLDATIVELDERYAEEDAKARVVAKKEQDLRQLQSRRDRVERLYNEIVNSLQGVDFSKDTGGYSQTMLEPPEAAFKAEPNLIKVMAISVLAGLLLGCGLGYVIELADKSFRTPSEVIRQLRLRLIGHIPLIHLPRGVIDENSGLDGSLVTYHYPQSAMAEAYRAVRTALFFNIRESDHQVIQITSPTQGEGKSTLSANLAISIAQSGKRVLLIDGDLRRPRQHQLFSVNAGRGTAAVLAGKADPNESIYATGIPGLSVMPCGDRPPNPAELVTSRRLQELIDVMREQFDFVIIDTPPLLAVTDPVAVAARVDGTILTFRLHKKAKTMAQDSRELLDSIGANVLGVVVNGVGNSRAGYSAGYRAGGGRYGYGGYTNAYVYQPDEEIPAAAQPDSHPAPQNREAAPRIPAQRTNRASPDGPPSLSLPPSPMEPND